jgi:hypothetical protein
MGAAVEGLTVNFREMSSQMQAQQTQVAQQFAELLAQLNRPPAAASTPPPTQTTPTSSASASAAASSLPPGYKPTPPERYGGDRFKLDTFLNLMDTYLTLAKINMYCKDSVLVAAQRLEDKAASWWLSVVKSTGDLYGGFANYISFKAGLQTFLSDPGQVERAMEKIAKLKQDGSVLNYITTFTELLHKIPHRSPEDALHNFKQGLKPFHYTYVIGHKPETLEDAKNLALEADAAYLHSQKRQYSPAPFRPSSSASGTAPMELNAISSFSRGRSASRGNPFSRGRSSTPGPSGRTSSRSDSPAAGLHSMLARLTSRPFTKLTPDESKFLTSKGHCTFCREKGHDLFKCPRRANVNSGSKQTSRSASPASRQER